MPELTSVASIRTRPHRRIAEQEGRFYPERYRPAYETHTAGWVTFNDHKGVISFGTLEQAVEWLAPVVRVVVHSCEK